MTLTTEQLNDYAGVFRKDAARWVENGEPEIALELHALADELDALAANREAQPVALVDRRPAASGGICWQHGGKDLQHGTELFTAPSTPAMPEEMTGGIAMRKYKVKKSNYVQWVKGWNACRSAMLAQPVSSGYKLPEGWISRDERMPKDGDVVLVFQEGGIIFCAEVDDGEFYPDEFPRVPTQGREITHWMPLPAAPEGGNGA